MIKSPIRYFGGKGGMKNEILQYFPDKSTYSIYVEPFGGGASILLARDLGHAEVYNDINKNVYSLFKVLSDNSLFQEFKNKCDLALYSAELREEYKNNLKDQSLTMGDRAFYFWYVNRTSHGGVGGFSKHRYTRRGMAKATSDFLSSVDRLKELHDRLSAVIIENKDALKLIEEYNDEKTFMYLDPPYSWETRTSTRYENDFSPEQQKQLIDTLLVNKAKVLLSGYTCVEYERLTNAGWQKIDFTVNTIGGDMKPKSKIETLWKNY